MKRFILVILLFALFIFVPHVFAFDTCEPYHIGDHEYVNVPCSYNGVDFDSAAVEAYVNTFFFKGSNYGLYTGTYYGLTSQYKTCDGLLMAYWGTVGCSHNFAFAIDSALFYGVGASYTLNDGLVAYYPFNGNANDESGNGNHGTIYNSTFVDGKSGSALEFSGDLTSYVEVPHSDSLSPSSAVSISLWAKEITASPAYSSLIYKAGGEPIGMFGERQYSLWTTASQAMHLTSTPEGSTNQIYTTSPNGSYVEGQFFHVAGVIDAPNHIMKIYVNGTKIQEYPYSGDQIRTGNYPLRIGGHFYHNFCDQSNFNGIIDEVRIYNRALSETEIQELYGQTSSVNWNVPYISQLSYPEWGQSACGTTSITMLLRYWYPNSLIDVPEVYHAGTQSNGYYSNPSRFGGAPLLGYYNVGWATSVWTGTSRDTGLQRVPKQFRSYHHGTYSGMALKNAINYLTNVWGGNAQTKTGQHMRDIINEIKSRPVILNVNEGYGGHYIVLRGYDEESQTFYINDPYPPYQDQDKKAPFPDANNVPVPYAKLQTWFKGTMITFEPAEDHTTEVRQNTVVVDNGIANFGDTGILNSNCNGSSHCFQIDNINAKTKIGYVWQSFHSGGKDWIYPIQRGHWVKWTPKLPKTGSYNVYTIFYGSSGCSNVKYDVHDSSGTLINSSTINQGQAGYQQEMVGYYYLSDGAYVKVENVPANCNMDAIMFQYVPN